MTWFPSITNRQKWDAWMAQELDRMAVTFQAQEIQAVRSGRVSC